eukprot:CAMPEP_0117427278 /NCGR_PEP_ID=MMETSP0758-20121206/7163_1 /TAXON_ID=63605 /ORGANISM="Percolomonas cosmopolitus, Strain AE-1 (ATCC 50343)" /LENGTH=185 /DNA_ID=CAMNT_0005212829 /DNA_START=169 /DNA_END=722 /DNA_ORIENTATION=+
MNTDLDARKAQLKYYLKKFQLPDTAPKAIVSAEAKDVYYRIHKTYTALKHVRWNWNMDMDNRFELEDEIAMCTKQAEALKAETEEEATLINEYMNALTTTWGYAEQASKISSAIISELDDFKNTFRAATDADIDTLSTHIDAYLKLLDDVPKEFKSKVEIEVGQDIVFLESSIHLQPLRLKYPQV